MIWLLKNMKDQKQIKKKIEAELKTGRYGSYGGEAEFLAYDFNKFQSFCCGGVQIGLGEGRFRGAVSDIIIMSGAWYAYQNRRYDLIKKYKLDAWN